MAQIYDWLVQTPADATNRDVRINVRPAHLAHNKPLIDSGVIVFGGPSLAYQPESPEADLPVTGSIMVIRAGSAEEVRDLLRNDPYAKAGFWYAEEATITPFKCVVRKQA